MKLVFISDIHGSITYAERAKEIFNRELGDYLIILGDILYHGPRNPLPEGYAPKDVVEVLNTLADKIVAVRGNCDADVDQMLLSFPMMSDYSIILHEGKRIFITHGHIYNEDNLPNLQEGDVIIHGHTHLLGEKLVDGIIIINPGSITLPKGGNEHSYGVLEGKEFTIKNLDGAIIQKISL